MAGLKYNLSYHKAAFRAKNRIRDRRQAKAADRGLDFMYENRNYGGDVREDLRQHIEAGFGPIEVLILKLVLTWLIEKIIAYFNSEMKDKME